LTQAPPQPATRGLFGRHPRAIDVIAELRAATPTSSLLPAYRALSFPHVAEIVRPLGRQRAVSATTSSSLLAELAAAQATCDAPSRAAAMDRFVAGADAGSSGAARALLRQAAEALRSSRIGCG
jgi:hypothetical protein